MNFRNKIAVMISRVLFGLFMMFSGISGLMAGKNATGIPEAMVPIMQVLWQTGLFHMIKITEIIAGLMLVINFLPALAALFLAPLAVGIIVFNSVLSPQYLPMGIIVALFEGYFGYVYWDKYKPLFELKKKK